MEHSAPERTFHVFYQLLAGAPEPFLAELRLSREATPGDAAGYARTCMAMADAGMGAGTQEVLWRLIGAVGKLRAVAPEDWIAASSTSEPHHVHPDIAVIASCLGVNPTTVMFYALDFH